MQDIYTKIFTSRKFWNIFIPVILFTLVSGGLFLFQNKPKTASAGWWNESWTYRKAIQVTNNSTEESNVYIEVVLDTSATTTIQSDCGDFRFATENGKELEYYIVSGCGTATNTIHIEFETFSAGSQDLYFYYGNPSAENGFQQNDFVTEASNYTLGSIGAEEVGKGPVGYWSFDEGYGLIAHDSSSGGNDGTITGATWQDESMCVSGKCLYFDGDDTTEVTVDTPDNMEKFTACVWFKANALSNIDGDSTMKILAKGWGLNLLDTGIIDFRVPTSAAHIEIESTIIISPNKWYYVCAINNSIGVDPQLYINGNDDSSNSYGGSGTISDDSANLLRIGAMYPNEYAYNFYGYIDEPKIYPYARTADQIKQDYNAGLAGVSTSKGTSVSFGSQSDSWMSDGLVGYWKMDETATTSGAIDSSGNGNNGTYHGTASTTGGKFGNGGVFDGDSDYINFDKGENLTSKNSLITLSAWVNPNSFVGGTILDKAYNTEVEFNMDCLGSGNVSFSVYNNNGDQFRVDSNKAISLNHWTHVLGVVDGSKMRLYIDGVLQDDANNINGALNQSTIDVYLGADKGIITADNFFNGQIDEVRIYNRALSPDEVKKLYEWAPGPVLHLKMDEKQGTTAYDSSGYGNDGTLSGAGWERGKYGSAISIDKVEDVVNAGNNTSLDIGAGTVMAWVKPRTLINSYPRILGKEQYASGDSFALYINASTGLAHLYIGGTYIVNSTTDFRDRLNKWTHVAVSLDGATAIMYINGISEDSAVNGNFPITTYPVRIGNNSNGTRRMDGILDDVKIYNYARTQKQILEDMNGGRPASKSPVAYWKFDEGYGATIHDESGNGNDGTASSSDSGTNTTVSEMWSLDGKYNKAMEFDGTDDMITVQDNDVLNFGTGDYSGTLWVKIATSSFVTILEKIDTDTGIGWAFYVNDDGNGASPGEIAFFEFDKAESGYEAQTYYSAEVNDNLWHHISFSVEKQKNQIIKLYFDGKLVEVIPTFSNLNVSNNAPVEFGFYPGDESPDIYFEGSVDEVKIFNYALSEDEVKKEYNRGAGVILGSTGLDSNGSADNSSNREYCIPGDTATCTPPVLELKMDEKEGATAYDTSGNGNDGTISGATWGRGKLGSGLEFDGVDDYVDLGDVLDAGTNDLTISSWVKINKSDTYFSIVNKANSSITDGRYEMSVSSEGTLLGMFDDGSARLVNGNISLGNNWSYVVAVFDRSDVLSLYVNGVFDDSVDISAGDGIGYNTSIDLMIGSINKSYAYFNGKIDDIKIYNYARTPAQIAWDYNRGKPIAEWRFDECQGNIIHDNSGNGNHGTITIGSSGSQTELGSCSSSTSASAWYNGRTGKTNSSLYFDGTDDHVLIGDLGASSSAISFWLKPGSLNQGILSLDVSEHYISIASGNIVTSGFVSPKIYVDGIESSKIDTGWHHVFVETTSEIDVSYLSIAYFDPDGSSSQYYAGQIDDLKIYNYFPTEEQIKMDYNSGSARF